MNNTTTTERTWNAAAYDKQKAICQKLTTKGVAMGLNQGASMTDEAREAYLDTLRERGCGEAWIQHNFGSPAPPAEPEAEPNDDATLRQALNLIKYHIDGREKQKNRDLHEAVQMIVTVARRHGLLLEHGGR